MKRGIIVRMARMEGIPKIVWDVGLIRSGMYYLWPQVNQVADEVLQSLVIIYQKSIFFLVKRREIIGIIFEERTHVVGRD